MLPVSYGRRLVLVALAIVVTVILAAPAFTQTTGICKGTVVDEKGQPVEKANITISFADGANRVYKVQTDKKGSFIQVGIQPGRYTVTAEKEKVGSQSFTIKVALGDPTEVKFQLSMHNPAAAASEDQKKAAAVQKLFDEGVTATSAGDFDGAIAKFNEAITLFPGCFDCYYNIGQANTQKKDYPAAEVAFKKSLELKADYADAYNGLTTVYNAQKKFDEAQAASQKAAELAGAGAGAGAGGGGNVNALYNQGVIAWNANKFEDAKAKFEQAIQADANHADSHFQLGMCLVNLGKLAEAGAEFETYMKLAPTGQYAAQAKSMIAAIPKK
ncbi:MAG: tetratricopeptide repeat protein [Bacteroidales bacterium]